MPSRARCRSGKRPCGGVCAGLLQRRAGGRWVCVGVWESGRRLQLAVCAMCVWGGGVDGDGLGVWVCGFVV
jgi:hypothetical protein